MPAVLKIEWDSLPWETHTDQSLARKLGCSSSTVWNRRRIHAPGTQHPTGNARDGKVYDFSKVNWNQRNEKIAKRLGCSESTVAKQRALLPKDEHVKQPRKPGSGRKVTTRYDRFNPAASDEVNAKNMKCKVSYATLLRRRFNKEKEKAK